MTNATGSFSRDANRVPIERNGLLVTKSVTLSGNTTQALPLFTVTGTVEVIALYGVVTTALGSNVTAAHWRINDQTIATQVISLATGTTLSSLPVGSTLTRISLITVALTAKTSATGTVSDPVAATAPDYFMPFVVVQKSGTTDKTNIEFVYTTNNSSAGAIKFYCGFVPLSDDGDITAV